MPDDGDYWFCLRDEEPVGYILDLASFGAIVGILLSEIAKFGRARLIERPVLPLEAHHPTVDPR